MDEFAAKLRARPEVDEVKVQSIDFNYWTLLLREKTRTAR
jgi:hypothetical protein